MIGLRGIAASAMAHLAVAGWLISHAESTPKPEEDMSAGEMISVSLDAPAPAQQAEDAPPPNVQEKTEMLPVDQVPEQVASLPQPAAETPPLPEIVQPEPAPKPEIIAAIDLTPAKEIQKPEPVRTVEKPKLVQKKIAPAVRKNTGDGKGASQPKVASAGAAGERAAATGGAAESRIYASMVLARLRAARPSAGGTGRVTLSFTISASGRVISAGASGSDAGLKSAAISMVHRAAPFPPIPASANKSRWSFSVPIQFN